MPKLATLLALALVALLLAAGCGGNAQPATTQPPATQTPTATTAPTPTPIPTPTPEPSPIPTAEEILRRSNEARGYEERDWVTNVKNEREEEYEGQPVWVISYEGGSGGIDSYVSVWRMEWIAKDSYLLLRQEELYHDSFAGGAWQEYYVNVFSDPSGESGGAGADTFSTDGLLFDGAISGVRVFTVIAWEEAGSPPQKDCDMEGVNPQPVSKAETVGTPLNINPTYLPAGAIEWTRDLSHVDPPAVICGGQVSHATRVYRTPPSLNQQVQDIGGWITIEKWRGPNLYVGDMLAAYVSAAEVNGKPAIFVRRTEIVAFELRDATYWATEGRVIIPEEFGFTVVRIVGPNLPFEEAVKIAEGLE